MAGNAISFRSSGEATSTPRRVCKLLQIYTYIELSEFLMTKFEYWTNSSCSFRTNIEQSVIHFQPASQFIGLSVISLHSFGKQSLGGAVKPLQKRTFPVIVFIFLTCNKRQLQWGLALRIWRTLSP